MVEETYGMSIYFNSNDKHCLKIICNNKESLKELGESIFKLRAQYSGEISIEDIVTKKETKANIREKMYIDIGSDKSFLYFNDKVYIIQSFNYEYVSNYILSLIEHKNVDIYSDCLGFSKGVIDLLKEKNVNIIELEMIKLP